MTLLFFHACLFFLLLWTSIIVTTSIAVDDLKSNLLVEKVILASGIYNNENSTKQDTIDLQHTVIITPVNEENIYLLNNFKCFLDRLKMKFLIIAMDSKTHEYLSKESQYIVHDFHSNQSSYPSFLSNSTNSPLDLLTFQKLAIVQTILKLGYDVLFTEIDVLFLTDPFPYLSSTHIDYFHSIDYWCAIGLIWNMNKTENVGHLDFYFVRSTNHTIQLFADVLQAAPKYPGVSGVKVFWDIMHQSISPPVLNIGICRDFKPNNHSVKSLVSCNLHQCLFTARMLQNKETYDRAVDNMVLVDSNPVTVQANHIPSKEQKIQTMKEYYLWLADETYPSPSNASASSCAIYKSYIHRSKAQKGKKKQKAINQPSVNTPEFRALAAETYQKVLPCLNATWMYENHSSLVPSTFPFDAQGHYEEVLQATESFRHQKIHSYADYSGPWIENIFIAKFIDHPLSYFRGFIPIFIQWVDEQVSSRHRMATIQSHLEKILRTDVIYFTVSQSAMGLMNIGPRFPNILVLSCGGFGHVPLPLIKGELPAIPAPIHFEHDIGFYGNIRQSTREEMCHKIQSIAEKLQLTYLEDQGSNWKEHMSSTKFNLAPRGFGRTSYRFAESIQLGRIPVFIYTDMPWIPYLGSKYSIENFGFVGGLNSTFDNLTEVVHQIKNLTLHASQYEAKLMKLAEVRHMFTYAGVITEIEKFLQDPFGPEGSLSCSSYPRSSH